MTIDNINADAIEVWIDDIDRSADVCLYTVEAFTGNKPEMATFEIINIGDNSTVPKVKSSSIQFTNSSVSVKAGDQWVHFGKIVSTEINYSSDGEQVIYLSRFDQHLFGIPIFKAPIAADADLSSIISVDGAEIVLNPLYEAVIVDNRIRVADSGVYDHPTMLAPEQAYQLNVTPSVSPWSLSYAVWFLCDWLNPNETYVTNPTFTELESVFPYDESIIRNVRFKTGSFLPEVLDDLLTPLGYGWKIVHLSRTSRKIEVFARDTTNTFTINSFVNTNANFDYYGMGAGDQVVRMNVKNDIVANSVNGVIVIGGRQQVESTFTLTPDWDPDLENEPYYKYQMGSTAWAATPGLQFVFRRWTVVPSNPMATSRSGMNSAQWQSMMGLPDPFFTRRKFLPCITRDPDNRPIGRYGGCQIEYAIIHEGESIVDVEWKTVEGSKDTYGLKDGSTLEVLDDELGIYFNGKMPPMRIQQVTTDKFGLRITATVESVARQIYVATETGSQLDDFKPIVLDMENQFPFRKLVDSVVAADDGGKYSGTVYSTTLMQEFGESVLSRQRIPQTSGTIVMPRIAHESTNRDVLGKAIEKVNEMDFSFNNGFTYPVINAWSINLPEQTTTLVLGGE